MRIAYGKLFDEKTKSRWLHLCEIGNFKTFNRFSEFLKYIFFSDEILISDNVNSLTTLMSFFIAIFYNKKIIYWAKEVYSICPLDFKNEFMSKNKSLKIKFHYKLKIIISLLMKQLSNKKRLELIVSSSLRTKYLKKKYPNAIFYTIRNLPCKKDILINRRIDYLKNWENPYLFLAGRVNNISSIETLLSKIENSNLKIIIAGNKEPEVSALAAKHKKKLVLLNYLDNNDVFNYISKSIGSIVIYNNNSINQRYSSSSKIFEYISIFCPLVVSNNVGVLSELKNFSYEYMLIDDFSINSFKKFQETHSKKTVNLINKINNLNFETECVLSGFSN